MPALPTPLTIGLLLSLLAPGACTDRETHLLRDLRGTDTELACGAAYLVGLRGAATPEQCAALLAQTSAPDALARYAIWALGEITDEVPGRREHLLHLLDHPRPDVRGPACWALARRYGDDAEIRGALESLRSDANQAVAEMAASALTGG